MIAETIPGLSALSADQKIMLAAELWREAVAETAETPDPEIVQALRERLDYHVKHPDQVSTWEAVRSKIAARKTAG